MHPKQAWQENCTVRNSSLGAGTGRGLFAIRNIPKNTTVGFYVGSFVEEWNPSNEYIMALYGGRHIDGRDLEANPMGYIQHACTSSRQVNCAMKHSRAHPDHTTEGYCHITSTKHIRVGTELFMNYGRSYYHTFLKGKCRCAYHHKRGIHPKQ
jgi:hypothetical protein